MTPIRLLVCAASAVISCGGPTASVGPVVRGAVSAAINSRGWSSDTIASNVARLDSSGSFYLLGGSRYSIIGFRTIVSAERILLVIPTGAAVGTFPLTDSFPAGPHAEYVYEKFVPDTTRAAYRSIGRGAGTMTIRVLDTLQHRLSGAFRFMARRIDGVVDSIDVEGGIFDAVW